MAVKTVNKNVIFQKVTAYICDCCHKEYTDDFEIQEFLCFHNTGGYGSVFGDGVEMNLDLCQHCVKELLGEFMQFKRRYGMKAQLCPKCNGQGVVSKPLGVAGDVTQWTSTSCTHQCDLCDGAKVIYVPDKEDKP